MATYEFNERIKFMLPAGFIFSRQEDDEGNEVVNIYTGEYENDEGETNYRFSCRVNYTEYDPNDVAEDITSDELLERLAENMENSRRIKLPGTPETILLNKAIPLSIFGHMIKMYGTIGLIQVDDWTVLNLVTAGRHSDDDPSVNSERYENFFEVLKAIRIDGKKLPIASVSPSEIEEALELTFEEDGEAIDVSPQLRFNFTAGDETRTYEYTSEGMKEVGREHLTRVTPDEALYPHYQIIRNAGGFGFPGASVVVNASGTEYEFIPLKNFIDYDEVEEDMKALYNRIIAKDTEPYDLHKKAKEMQKLFHVNEAVFDPHHDRECELEEGYMHRAYMMSGLRSFAWTLADYCKQHECTPEDIDNTIASRIANFVAQEDWLNYDGNTYCQGLCSGSDLHVYYVPDSVTKADQKKLLPTKEDYDRVNQMKQTFSSYREILNEVHSLNALRKDLKYIYPAVEALWDSLEEGRNYDEALLGNEADIVYAWCALALAAKEPFYSEDGPMSCFFSQPFDEEAYRAKREAEEAEEAEEAAEEWLQKYEKYLENDPVINFNGTIFVFSGLTSHYAEKDHPTVQKVIEKGGQYRSKVSGLTNYLVVDPRYAGQSKIVAVMEQLQKGKNIKVILLEDLERALEDNTASKNASSTPKAASTPKTSSKSTQSGSTTNKTKASSQKDISKAVKIPESDCDIDDEDILIRYNGSETDLILPEDAFTIIGEDAFSCNNEVYSVIIPEGVEEIQNDAFYLCTNLKDVVLPSTIQKIGDNAFRNTAIKSIVIPNGCESIGADCFTSCHDLADIYVPASVKSIGDDAFYTFNDATVIHTPKGSAADSFANSQNSKVAYDYTWEEKTVKKTSKAKKPPVEVIKLSWGDCVVSDSMPKVFAGYNGIAKDIILPEGFTTIGRNAMLSNETITSIEIPEGVKTIEEGAFQFCKKLKKVTLPSTIKKIENDAFYSTALESIVIPDGCVELGEDCFEFCQRMKDLYVPASVTKIGEDALQTFSNKAVIHTPKGSAAERVAIENGWEVDNKAAPDTKPQTSASNPSVSKKKGASAVENDVSTLSDTLKDLNAQVADMQNRQLSDVDHEKLNDAKGKLDSLTESLNAGETTIGKYGEYLAQKEAREKAHEEEKARQKAEALAAGKSEKDIVNMYIILTNEKKLGKLQRSTDEFFEIYEDDFSALSKNEIINTRKDILEEMEDESLCSYYAESFRQRTLEDRFSVSTKNLYNVSDEADPVIRADWAVENTKEWYAPSEYSEVRKLMDETLKDIKRQLDEQFKPVEEGWTKFSTAKDLLEISITDKAADDSDLDPVFSNFQKVIGNQLVTVKLVTKGFIRMSTTAMNYFPYYWDVTIRDIWEAALKNVNDERAGAYNGNDLANQAINQVRIKHPETKAFSSGSDLPATTSTTSIQPKKKEGCYIATAVYGSYDAPQVLVLRRFRDETLKNSAFGRWFIRTYYRISPPIAEKLKNAKRINHIVRSILDKWVAKMTNKQK